MDETVGWLLVILAVVLIFAAPFLKGLLANKAGDALHNAYAKRKNAEDGNNSQNLADRYGKKD